jgi:hypothetical protein
VWGGGSLKKAKVAVKGKGRRFLKKGKGSASALRLAGEKAVFWPEAAVLQGVYAGNRH